MTVAILVSDVDRTLLTHDHVLPEAVCAAVRLARARGLRVMLASARSPVGIAPIARRLGTEALAICFNGAWIGSLETGATLDTRPLGHGDAVAALAAARAAGLPAIAYGAAAAYATAADAAATAPELAITGEPLVEIAAPGALDAPVFKVMAVAHGPEAEARFVALRAGLPAGLAAARSAGHLLEIVAPSVSKGAAAAQAAASLGLDGAAAAAAGDAENDLSLLAWAGIRLTVANAAPAVKALADHVGPSCDEGGIAEAIAWLLEHAGGAG